MMLNKNLCVWFSESGELFFIINLYIFWLFSPCDSWWRKFLISQADYCIFFFAHF